MARKLRDPNANLSAPTPEQIRGTLVDIWSIVSPYSASQAADYTLTGAAAHEMVVCTNTTSTTITITLNPKPKDLEEVTIKRTDGPVTISGNGKTMDGQSTVSLALYDGPNMIYTDAAAEWSFV